MKFYLWFNLQILDIHSLFYKYHLNPNSNPLVGLYYHPPNGYNAKLHMQTFGWMWTRWLVL